MARKRTIPFGYCMKNGEITIEPKEVYAVATIFSEYLNGKSLLQIAKLMEREKIRYSSDTYMWNKNIVKRIIENPKYLGIDNYAQIIDKEVFKQANEKRLQKASTLNLIPEDLRAIRNVTYCAECGHRFSRIGGNTKYAHWDCRNTDCFRFEYRLTDQIIIGAVLNVLNSAIAKPSILEVGGEVSTYSSTADIIRQQNEIKRMMDCAQIDIDRAKIEIYKLAQMTYDCCTYNDGLQKTERLKLLFENHKQLNILDVGLFKSCVSRVWISHFCNIEVEFINGVKIKTITGKGENNDYSTKCNNYSREGTNG